MHLTKEERKSGKKILVGQKKIGENGLSVKKTR